MRKNHVYWSGFVGHPIEICLGNWQEDWEAIVLGTALLIAARNVVVQSVPKPLLEYDTDMVIEDALSFFQTVFGDDWSDTKNYSSLMVFFWIKRTPAYWDALNVWFRSRYWQHKEKHDKWLRKPKQVIKLEQQSLDSLLGFAER